jgi:NAD(P)-dependent dehydrogenase (short-subunit alcohol dehydrogenase family)
LYAKSETEGQENSMSDMLKDKVILVTGAGRGVGRDIAIMAASQGAKVVVNDLGGEADGEGADKSPAMEVVGDIKEAGGDAVANYGSVADFETAEAIIQQAVDTYGRIDGVVNNAGILRDVIFHKMTEEDWDTVISVHLKGSFNVARAAATRFREQGSGAMVHMTSTSGGPHDFYIRSDRKLRPSQLCRCKAWHRRFVEVGGP